MTLVLGLRAKDGLLLISDSQITHETAWQPVKTTHEKIFAHWNNVAWGASTNRSGVVQHVGVQLASAFNHRSTFAKKRRYDIRASLTKEVSSKVREILQRTIQLPGQQPPLVNFLFIGYAQDGPFILEIHPDLTDTDHIDIGYAAIGSAEIFPYYALASLKHYNIRQRTLVEAKLIGYRIVQDAIKVAAHGIGPPVQMIEIAEPAAGDHAIEARRLSEDDMRILDESVVGWKEAEVEVLSRQLGLPVEPVSADTAPAEAVPAPEQPPPEPSQ